MKVARRLLTLVLASFAFPAAAILVMIGAVHAAIQLHALWPVLTGAGLMLAAFVIAASLGPTARRFRARRPLPSDPGLRRPIELTDPYRDIRF
ncbi:MAG: hypothetical protein JWP01_2419 [Myxococcales bacterium]|nr:hypothetical protein [Myxococcales bacterium]